MSPPAGGTRKVISREAAPSLNDKGGDGEEDSTESLMRATSTILPSSDHATSTTATGLCDSIVCWADSGTTDIRMGELDTPLAQNDSESSATAKHLTFPSDSSDELFCAVVDTWISDHELSVAAHPQSHGNKTVTNTNSFSGEDSSSINPKSSYALETETECNPDLQCQPLPHTAATNGHLCLISDQPVLFGLALLAERVVGMLEDMFHLAARSAQSLEKANDLLWSGTPRSLRSVGTPSTALAP
ncbi:hypothetical protein F5Y19DRAFT_477212 [Xylariaceae sp. FL1651]|nr:hypothetical protein F5Y19DRAFT_477212 [Xylariaceae sp. FL1651]